jgi:hypothetical protein
MASTPFPIPERLSPTLLRAHSYWESLKRAGNSMPFWDDVNLSSLPDLKERLLLIDVFVNPERFRFNVIGQAFGLQYTGAFLDKSDLGGPLAFLRSQCSATVEARSPTCYHQDATKEAPGFSRLLMPMWGDGHIGMLLGALEMQ